MTVRPPEPDFTAVPARLIAQHTRGARPARCGSHRRLGRRSAGAARVDRRVAERIGLRHGAAGMLAQRVADLGGLVPVSVASGLVAVPARRRHGALGVALVVLGPALARVTSSLVLKPVVGRTTRGRLVYPSGHTTSVTSRAVAAAVLVLGADDRSRRGRADLGLGLAVPVVAVGAALVGRGCHDATETVGAVGVALVVVLTLAPALDAVATDRPCDRLLPR